MKTTRSKISLICYLINNIFWNTCLQLHHYHIPSPFVFPPVHWLLNHFRFHEAGTWVTVVTKCLWLEALVSSQSCIVGVSETWCNECPHQRAGMEGYMLLRRERQGSWGECITLYVRERFDCTALTITDYVFWSLWMRIRGMENKKTCGCLLPVAQPGCWHRGVAFFKEEAVSWAHGWTCLSRKK